MQREVNERERERQGEREKEKEKEEERRKEGKSEIHSTTIKTWPMEYVFLLLEKVTLWQPGEKEREREGEREDMPQGKKVSPQSLEWGFIRLLGNR